MTQQEAEKTPNVVTGTMTICSKTTYVLINLGATRSFVSRAFAMHVNKRLEPWLDALLVHTSVGDHVIIEHV